MTDVFAGKGEPEDGDLVASAPMVEVPKEVLKAVRTLIAWAGDDPAREGLLDTPARVARAWKEYARGYARGSGGASVADLRGSRRL